MTSLEQRPSLEDRIRAATSAAASTVPDDGAPPLDLRAQRRRTHRLPEGLKDIRVGRRIWPGRPSLSRLGTPLAATAAVIAVVAASVAVADRSHSPAPSARTLSAVPRYNLELRWAYKAGSSHGQRIIPLGSDLAQHAIIRDTITGATVATVRPLRPFDTFVAATAAANDRTFVVAAQNVSLSALAPCGPTRLFLARFSPADRHVALTALRGAEFPAATQVDAIAISPDGTKLAVAVQARRNCLPSGARLSSPGAIKKLSEPHAALKVYFLPTGTVKTWQFGPTWTDGSAVGQNAMSWAADGTLAVNFPGEGRASGMGVMLLNTNGAGGSLPDDSHTVSVWAPPTYPLSQHVTPALPRQWTWRGYAFLTPDGKTVVVPVQPIPHRAGGAGAAFAEFSASTGSLVRVLWPERAAHRAGRTPDYSVVWTNSSGTVLVASETRGGKTGTEPVFGVLRGRRFTAIPGTQSRGAPTVFGETIIVF